MPEKPLLTHFRTGCAREILYKISENPHVCKTETVKTAKIMRQCAGSYLCTGLYDRLNPTLASTGILSTSTAVR